MMLNACALCIWVYHVVSWYDVMFSSLMAHILQDHTSVAAGSAANPGLLTVRKMMWDVCAGLLVCLCSAHPSGLSAS
jgi:hypothetical protein